MVALTTATATLPGSSFNSRAASALISDTTMNGPHFISTCAITPSTTTLVTSPVNRLRAELAMPSGSFGAAPEFGGRELGERLARDDFAARLILVDGQRSVVDPAADGVVADPEKVGGVADPNHRHACILSALSELEYVYNRKRGNMAVWSFDLPARNP